ncbi:MAG: hypothetical protein GX439_07225 [Bacteroidales bacterium]|nr:hypothetical protein [Bacteroidales bacterium]
MAHRYRYELLLAIVTGILLLAGLGKIEVNIMEARNFTTAREMVQNREYLLTTLNGEPRYQKPPLPTWLTALSGAAFGFDSLFTLRLPVVAITFLLVFAFYFLSQGLGLSKKQSFNNALILITSFYIFFGGRDNQWDMYTHAFMVTSIFFLWRLLQKDTHRLGNSIAAGVFFGLSILSKGPISLYALFLPFLISYGMVYRFHLKGKGIYLINMLFIGLLVGLWWYAYVRLKDPEYFRAIVGHEAANWASYETKPFYYYWNFFIQSGLWTLPSLTALAYPYLKKRVDNLKAYRFSLLWTLFSVILLSAVPEKKPRYLLPTLIPMAINTGFYIDYLFRRFNKGLPRAEKLWVYFSFGLLGFIALAYPFALTFILKTDILNYLPIAIISSILMLTCAFFILRGMKSFNFQITFYSTIALFTVVVVAIIPLSQNLFTNPAYKPASSALNVEAKYGVKTYRLNDIAPEIVWDFGKVIPSLPKINENIQAPPEKQFGLLVARSDSTIVRSGFPNFEVKKVHTIDMNYRPRHRDRLIRDYYVLRLKE